MLTVQHTENFRIESPSIVTIGTFDGVHLGHRKILKRLRQLKDTTGLKTVVLTFEPHPRKVLFPDQSDLKILTLVDEKLLLLETAGVDVAVVYPFSKKFAEIDSEQYIGEILKRSLNVAHLVIGYDHRFGKNRGGDYRTLQQFAPQYGFQLEEISALDIDNIAISSSKIRKALEEGNVTLASQFLGYNYFLNGTVVRGKQLGRTLGFPTANIRVSGKDKLLPAKGVYFVSVDISGKNYFGMMSVGVNPTTDDDEKIKIEVNIFDFNEDIYNKPVSINFIKRLRQEEKFANLTELKHALVKDKEACLRLIKETIL